MVKKIISNRNVRQKAYEEIRQFIIGDDLLPGAKIDEEALAKHLGVSKTPVREALSRLGHDGIVNIVPRRGAYKVRLCEDDILEVMVIREVLEGLCIRLAVQNINGSAIKKLRGFLDDFEAKELRENSIAYSETMSKFYALIYKTARNSRLIKIIKSMYDLTRMFRFLYFNDNERVRHSIEIHRKLIDVLEKRDADLAEEIRKGMVRSAYEYVIEKTSNIQNSRPIKGHDRIEPLGY